MRGSSKSLIVRDDLPLFGLIVREDGEDVTHYGEVGRRPTYSP
jgi:hypothetical protein